MASVAIIALIEPGRELLQFFQRNGRAPNSWSEVAYTRPHHLDLPLFGITLPPQRDFARD